MDGGKEGGVDRIAESLTETHAVTPNRSPRPHFARGGSGGRVSAMDGAKVKNDGCEKERETKTHTHTHT